jgi:sugar/nucleoside kinase (ribokinase family)
MTPDLPLPPRDARLFDVVGYGENSLDFLAVLGKWPAPDSKVALDSFEFHPGGQVATAVLAAARLGCRARYVGVFGDDRWAADVRGAVGAGGVDLVAIERRGTPTRTAVILVDAAGRRTVLERRDPRLGLRDGEVDAAVFQSGRILMIDATDVPGSIGAARAARAAGARVMVDVDRPVEGLEPLLRLADVVIASAQFTQPAAAKTAAADALAASGKPAAQVWITTLGADGSVAWDGEREIRTPGRVVAARDTTGAGDVFRGAFAAKWASGGSDLEGLLDYANSAAALACRELGAQGALPTPAEVDWLLAKPL